MLVVQMLCDCVTLVLASISCLQARHPPRPPPQRFSWSHHPQSHAGGQTKLAAVKGQAHI